MSTEKTLTHLIARFENNLDAYKSPKYNEAQLRQEFINPLFESLGWDVSNRKGYAEAYKDVIHEDAIKVGGATKAPDYSFRIGGVRKFFLETKKPSVNIKDDPEPAFQLRRYAWSAKLPLSILTDFEEFAVYDCRIKPSPNDKPSTGRIMYFNYKEYPEKWEEISSVFSREAILKGSFDRYVESEKKKRGTAEVDDAFLKEIESWRDALARNIALRNPGLTERDVNYAVQLTIDRIIFLRICEDRGIEEYGRLQALLNGEHSYKRIVDLYYRADEKYNSGLFHFQSERGRPGQPDELTPDLKIDDKVLKDIIKGLYYPESPYEFSVLPVDILGHVYERFLGKVIRLTAGGRAKIEEKPEVRKAGGVYYTPKYIVDYIVQNTVGRLLWGYPAKSDGTCLGCGLSVVGSRLSGVGGLGSGAGEGPLNQKTSTYRKGEKNEKEDSDIQGSRGVAGVDESSGDNIQGNEGVSAGGTVRTGESIAESGRIGTCKYCGRTQPSNKKGVSSASLDRSGLAGGAGDISSSGDATGIPDKGSDEGNLGTNADSRQTTQRPDKSSQVTIAGIPDPRPPKPVPKSTPKQAAKFRILDPACGSGSFLIGAYEYLLDWHRDWYVENDPSKHSKQIYQGAGGLWYLTTAEKKRILLNNIYGVDIDPQAVEVTKLNLLLKALEGENEQTLESQLRMFRERALPDLRSNIKCGNSLIGPNFYDDTQLDLLDDEERYRINVFDWEREFPEIFKQGGPVHRSSTKESVGGFDCVIGNPPYVRIQGLKEFAPKEVEYYKQRYKASQKGNYDIYVVFVEKGLELLKDSRLLGFIMPNKFFNSNYGEPLREIISENKYLSHVVHFGHQQVFAGATTYTCLLFLRKTLNETFNVVKVNNILKWVNGNGSEIGEINSKLISKKEWNLHVGHGADLLLRLKNDFQNLGEVADIFVGLQTSADDVYILDFVKETRGTLHLKSKLLDEVIIFEKDLFYPLISGTDVKGYHPLQKRQYILFPYSISGNQFELIDFKELSNNFPRTAEYLIQNKERLEDREKGKKKGKDWYGYVYHKNMTKQKLKKLCMPRLVQYLYCTLDEDGGFYLDNVDVGGIVFNRNNNHLELKYLMGLLNSKLLRWYFPNVSASFRGGWYSANKQFISHLPIILIDKDHKYENDLYNRIVDLVDKLLDLHKQLAAAKSAPEKTAIQRQIDATDKQIDELVYELYGITIEERRVIEGMNR
jgi:type I restriction-modification system DNA methylase subunit/predicted type IV restriction endonuclease